MTCVYRIRNLINGKVYIGSAVDVNVRWYYHKYQLGKHNHHSKHLQRAWEKYGDANFVFEIIEETSISDLLKREQYYLDTIMPWNVNIGYNTNMNAKTRLGIRHSEESKEKNRMSQLKRKDINVQQQIGKNGYWYGKQQSAQSSMKKSNANIERYSIPENKQKHSDRMKQWWKERKEQN